LMQNLTQAVERELAVQRQHLRLPAPSTPALLVPTTQEEVRKTGRQIRVQSSVLHQQTEAARQLRQQKLVLFETVRQMKAAGLGIGDVVDHYEGIIRGLDATPIIVGHSFGGLITQILLDRGLGCAGVAIAPAPVKGIILLPFSTLRVSFPALSNPTNNHRAVALTPEQFHYAFTNTLSEEQSLKVYERYAVPGPDHVLFQAAFANFNPHAASAVNFDNSSRAPLLLIAGGKDHVSPASVVKTNYELYRKSSSITEYKEYAERTHYTLGQDGWEDVADEVLDWAVRHASTRLVSVS
jgi:pimeloyl-ACP methyl ester carboxylesterase